MPASLLAHLGLQMLFWNVTSLGSVIAWVTEYASGFAGGFVLFTVGVLNLAKAYATFKGHQKK